MLDAHIIEPRQIVLAFSGGMDSRVMLDLLATYRDIHPQHDYLIFHVHHGLSCNADHWLEQCRQWAEQAGFAFKACYVQLKTKGESIEKVAREARYQAIIENTHQGALVLTAQHADDQAETLFLALKRGSGPAGLAAMPLLRKLGHAELLRPLLQSTRREIQDYAQTQGLNWVNDESNDDLRFDRNFIRHRILHDAEQRWSSFTKSINRTALLCAEQEQLLDELLFSYEKKVTNYDQSLALAVLQSYSLLMQSALIRRWYKSNTQESLSQAQLQQVFSSIIDASADANPLLKLGQWQIRRYQNSLFLLRNHQDITAWESELLLNLPLTLPDHLGKLTLLSGGNQQHALTLTKPKHDEQVFVRFNPEGLFAHPFGRQGKRKLKKLFQEYGVPSWLRRRTPLIFYGNQLVAVADLFVCQGFEGHSCQLLWEQC